MYIISIVISMGNGVYYSSTLSVAELYHGFCLLSRTLVSDWH